MKSNSLELIGLQVARDGQVLIHGLTYRLAAGELLLVQGKNGAGKSTLLKTIAGLIRPRAGQIHIAGLPATHAPAPLYIGHKRGLTLSMSVRDNIAIWAQLSQNADLIGAALHYWDLEGLENVPLHTLSAGWQQRVALARLIAVPSGIWLLDEPIANLDGEGIGLLHSLIQTRLEQGGIVLITSHADWQDEKVKKLNISELAQVSEVIH